MTRLVDCPSCGSFVPAGRPCCPHCHCRYSRWRRLVLVASALLGLGGCGDSTPVRHYGSPVFPNDLGVQLPPPADLAHPESD